MRCSAARQRRSRLLAAAILLSSGTAGFADEDERLHRVTFTDDAQAVHTVEARLLVEAQDGGILLLGRDGKLWNVTPDRLQKHETTEDDFQPFSAEEMTARLKDEFGAGFEVVVTRHYVICTNAGRKYGEWCGSLFERLLTSFRAHWRRQQLELHAPTFPLTAVVFADEKQFAKFATADAGPATANSKGYYSVRTNRIVLYDLTAESGAGRAASVVEINRRLGTALFNVATIVHEATHQIAFNCGLHTRYADNPLWLTEGMAMYFETPDLRSRTGWRTVGQVNRLRLRRFQDYLLGRRKDDSLATLLSNDDRFRGAQTAEDAYAEAWALNYFLIKTRRKEYVEYLNGLAEKRPLVWNKPEERLQEFQAAFGEDLNELDRAFVGYVGRLR